MVKSKKQANSILQLEKLPSLPHLMLVKHLELNYLEGKKEMECEAYDYTIKDTGGITLTP
jgi:hypothetical protein